MFTLPIPLHPALVHFPIVLLVVGAGVAVLALFLNRWHLSWIAAILLVLGAVGAFVAVQTGESAQDDAGKLSSAAVPLMDEHEEWADRTEIVAGIASGLALAAAALGWVVVLQTKRGEKRSQGESTKSANSWFSLRGAACGARGLAAVAGLVACFFVYQTARRGGKLVYEHGVGVKISTVSGHASPAAGEHDDD